MKKNIIYLTGFMGAGKSTIGPILANTLGWDYYDLDKVIEQKEGKKIREIFADSGEGYFRVLESEMLKKISSGDNLIISLGGGTICSGDNIAFLKNNGQIIYLKTSVESVYKRVLHKNDRPVLNTDELSGVPKEEVLLKLNAIFAVRKPYYEQADFTLETENIPIGRTIDNLARYINNHIKGQRFEKDNH